MTAAPRLARFEPRRAALGAWLAIHYAQLAPWSAELFSSQGCLPDAAASPLARLFPNALAWFDAPWFVTAFVALAAAAAAGFAAGWRVRACAVVLWYVGACLVGRHPLTNNPGLPFVGWLLLAHAALPADAAAEGRWPPLFRRVLWIVLAVGYSWSGLAKLGSPSWLDGSALERLLATNPLVRPTPLRDALLALPGPLLQAATWGALALEIGFAPLALVRRLRPWLWCAMVGMHLSLLALLDFADLTLGMVMVHLFAWPFAWPAARRGAAVTTDRAACDPGSPAAPGACPSR